MNKSHDQIVISYRREDSAGLTGRIYDVLIRKFGEEEVFKDIDSIPLGVNFKKYLEKVLTHCKILIVIIGDRWLEIKSSAGNRRLDHSQDIVRIEIETALHLGVPIIPVLVQNAKMPEAVDLPSSLQELAYINGISVGNDPYFHVDMDRLIKGIEGILLSKSNSNDSILQEVIPDLHTLIINQDKKDVLGRYKYDDTLIWTNGHLFEIAADIPKELEGLFPLKVNPGVESYIRGIQNQINAKWVTANVVYPSSKEGYIELTSRKSKTNVFLNPIYYKYLTARYPNAQVMIGETYNTICLFILRGRLIAGVIGLNFN